MSRRPHSDLPLWIDWRLPNGRSGKLGPFFGTAAASAAAELGERHKSMVRLTQREPRQWVVTELRLIEVDSARSSTEFVDTSR
jgi:hypothetical protein